MNSQILYTDSKVLYVRVGFSSPSHTSELVSTHVVSYPVEEGPIDVALNMRREIARWYNFTEEDEERKLYYEVYHSFKDKAPFLYSSNSPFQRKRLESLKGATICQRLVGYLKRLVGR